jgi:retron-type reverse transcriptase
MREAYMRTRKDGATGIDGVTAQEYEANLEANLRDLLERIKSGCYGAPPVRRTYIPKADGSQRPISIPTFEDKVAQRAIAMVLEAVIPPGPEAYGRSPRDASRLEELCLRLASRPALACRTIRS